MNSRRTALIALPLPLRKTFTYLIPTRLEASCRVGTRVVIPFGRRQMAGLVVGVEMGGGESRELKEVREVLDGEPLVSRELLDFTRWLSEYYFASWGQLIQAALPFALKSPTRVKWVLTDAGRAVLEHPFSEVRPSERRVLDLLARRGPLRESQVKKSFPAIRRDLGRRLLDRGLIRSIEEVARLLPARREEEWVRPPQDAMDSSPARLGEKQKRLLAILAQAGAMRVSELLKAAGASRASLAGLAARGRVNLEMRSQERIPEGVEGQKPFPPLPLTPAQRRAADAVVESVRTMQFETFLLKGVTGSGKTEVYLNAAAATLDQGRNVLYLVPEIGLTPLLVRRLSGRFPGQVAMLHSGLSEGERRAQWERIRQGRASLILGTRSALFAPMARLGLVVVDEEQDTSYVQTDAPRYNARDAAVVRAQGAGATVILGSATPSIEAVSAAQRGKFHLLELPRRVKDRPLPEVHLIDMREEFRATGAQMVLSRELVSAIRETADRGEQALILLNRRGYASFLLCRACGHYERCRRCSIALTYHRAQGRLLCHYCTSTSRPPQACPTCGSAHLHQVGAGTERLEEAVRTVAPSLRVARMDRDTAGGKKQVRLLERFDRGELDLVLGTQMVAKGHDFPGVTLVGVVSADAYLGLPDFRAAERTFQLLTQVAGRAGRGDRPGRVLVQAFATEHYALQAVARGDPDHFYRKELRLRRLMRYPPWVFLTQILIREHNPARGERNARRVAEALRAFSRNRFELLGPSLAPLPKIKSEYRFQILLKGRSRLHMANGIREALSDLESKPERPRNLVIEPDPQSLL